MTTKISGSRVDSAQYNKNGFSIKGILQSVRQAFGAYASGVPRISVSTTPTTSSGTLLFTQTITPSYAGTTLEIDVRALMASSAGGGDYAQLHIFVGTTLLNSAATYLTVATAPGLVSGSAQYTTVSTAPVTITVRYGCAAGDALINVAGGTQGPWLGAGNSTWMTVKEIG